MIRAFKGKKFRQQFVFSHRQKGAAGLISVEPDSPTEPHEFGAPLRMPFSRTVGLESG